MITKVLVYVHYDHLEYESDLNVWLQTESGEITRPCWDPDDVDGFMDSICIQLSGENEVDLQVVQDEDTVPIDFFREFKDRDVPLLEKSRSTWKRAEIKDVITKNFNNTFQDAAVENRDRKPEPVSGPRPAEHNGKISLAQLMIEVAKGEIY